MSQPHAWVLDPEDLGHAPEFERRLRRRHHGDHAVKSAAADRVGRSRTRATTRPQDDARHWAARQRPTSGEALRKNLPIGAARSRMLMSIIRAKRLAGQDTLLTVVDQSELG